MQRRSAQFVVRNHEEGDGVRVRFGFRFRGSGGRCQDWFSWVGWQVSGLV
jgi:hypothetical protein